VETVRDVVTALACDGATVVSILGALPTYILDALVIGCEVCGGKGFLAKPSGDFPDPGSTFISCPSCHGKSFVVSKDAWAAFGDVLGAELREALDLPEGEMSQLIDAVTSRCARALLGGAVYEATVVLEGDRIAILGKEVK